MKTIARGFIEPHARDRLLGQQTRKIVKKTIESCGIVFELKE